MGAVGHTGQGCHLLALASGSDKDKLLVGITVHIVDTDEGLVRNLHIAEVCGDLNNRLHAPALKDNLPAVLVGRIDELLHTIHIGSEGCNDDSSLLMLCKKGIKGLGYLGLRRGKARAEGVGTVAQNSQHSFFTNNP